MAFVSMHRDNLRRSTMCRIELGDEDLHRAGGEPGLREILNLPTEGEILMEVEKIVHVLRWLQDQGRLNACPMSPAAEQLTVKLLDGA